MSQPNSNQPVNFDGWVMVSEYAPGVLLVTDFEALDTHRAEMPLCDTDHEVDRSARYQLSNPEEFTVLCQGCVEALYANRAVATGSPYVMGALPAN